MRKGIGVCFSIIGVLLITLGAFAYYSTTVTGNVGGNTFSYSFNVLSGSNNFTTINLYDTASVHNGTGSVVVPGDYGSFSLKLVGTGSGVGIDYTISFSGTNVPRNMKFYRDSSYTNQIVIGTNTITGYMAYSTVMENTCTIYWKWPYDNGTNNDYDYEDANKNITINVSIVSKQRA